MNDIYELAEELNVPEDVAADMLFYYFLNNENEENSAGGSCGGGILSFLLVREYLRELDELGRFADRCRQIRAEAKANKGVKGAKWETVKKVLDLLFVPDWHNKNGDI